MRANPAVLTSLLLAGCGAQEVPRAAPGKGPPIATIVPTAAPSAQPTEEIDECPDKPTPVVGFGAGGSWVGFFGRPYDPEPGPSQGASWDFSAPGLPAISKDGTRVLVYSENPVIFGESSDEALHVMRVSDEKVLSTQGLRAGDFRKVHQDGMDAAQIGRAYDELARETGRHIQDIDARITAEGWSPLVSCRIDIQPGETKPSCNMKNQEIRCGDWLSVAYEEARLDLSVRGKKIILKKPEWRHARDTIHDIDVNGCLDRAYYDPARAIFVMHIDYECQSGGDSCFFPGAWHTVKLPAAVGADPPRAAAARDCPAGMTAIPAGSVIIGPPDDETRKRPPQPPVSVGALCLDTHEVTVADYAACVKTGRCFSPDESRWTRSVPDETAPEVSERSGECNWGVPGRDQHPMNCVAWSFAKEYCAWAGKRLPSEREWQWAATGPEVRRYPSGAEARADGLCWSKKTEETCAAGGSPGDIGPFGGMDLGGNVSEWTSSDYREHDACWIQGGFVVRGSNYAEMKAENLRGERRRYVAGSTHEPWLGFRCATDKAP